MTCDAGAPVVAGADGSARGWDAVEAGAIEATLHHRPLRIVHVCRFPNAPGSANRDRAEVILADAVEIAQKVAPEAETTAEIVAGHPAAELVREGHSAFLVVLGDRGTGAPAGLLLGSVAEQTATHAGCPVLVVRGSVAGGGPVVVGVDGSDGSVVALEFAAQEASLRRAPLLAVHVWDGAWVERGDPAPLTARFRTSAEIESRVLSESLAGIAGRYPDVRLERSIVRGDPRSVLRRHSDAAQLIVVESPGHGSFPDLLLGSTSRYLMHHSGCPTAIVRARRPARPLRTCCPASPGAEARRSEGDDREGP
jgi:nucleotide-binding universal stress UspA family protein